MKGFENISSNTADVMKEIGSIGMGNASTALSSLLNTTITMEVPKVDILKFSKVVEVVGNPEDEVVAVLVNMTQNLSGSLLVYFKLKTVNVITKAMLNKTYDSYDDLDELGMSALIEIGNILISSYINALSALVDIDITLEVPSYTINMIGAILNVLMVQVGYDADHLLMVSGKSIIDNETHDISVIMAPTVETLEQIFGKLGVY